MDDIRRAPNDVLSSEEPIHEVHQPARLRTRTHGDYLAPPNRSYDKLTEH